MADNRRVFLLSEILLREDWTTSNLLSYQPTPTPAATPSTMDAPNTGYFIGGATSGLNALSKVDKISYASDSTARIPSADLISTRQYHTSVGDSNSGYIYGGYINSAGTSLTDKITYSVDISTRIPSANSPLPHYGKGATGTTTVGYFGSGVYTSPTPQGARSTIEKITYSTDTNSTSSATLSALRDFMGSTGNTTAGYFGGGNTVSTTDKLTYSTETSVAVPGAFLSVKRYGVSATGNSTAGYFAGGSDQQSLPFKFYSTVDKLTYSTDTRTTVPGAALSNSLLANAATGNSESGYFSGGQLGPSPAYLTTTDKIDFSTDTRTTVPSSFLPTNTNFHSAASARANALPETIPLAYTVPNTQYIGGDGVVDRINHSSDTVDRIPSISVPSVNVAAASSPTAGYFAAGLTFAKLIYSTDTASNLSATLSLNRNSMNATASPSVGYFRGGSGNVTTTDKLTYSTDTRTTVPSSFLITGRQFAGSAGNSTTGYYAGGLVGAGTSNTEIITYSIDAAATAPGASLLFPRSYLAATGNSAFGYFAGGRNTNIPTVPVSRIDKITYSTNTIAALPAALSFNIEQLSASGNSFSGYFSGGATASPGTPVLSLISKLSYSTDTLSTTTNLRLPSTRGLIYATGALSDALPFTQPGLAPSPAPTEPPDVGYFAGGLTTGATTFSTIAKVDFATDLNTILSTRSSFARYSGSATSSLTAGYFSGGGPGFTYVEKLTYSTEALSAIFTAFIPGPAIAEYGHASTGNSLAGYFTGGLFTPSNTDKITYSTDTNSAVPSAILNPARYSHAAAGNSSAGYFTGGLVAPGGSTILSNTDKLTYSTETIARIPGASMPLDTYTHGASGNAGESYHSGGTTAPAITSISSRLTYSTETFVTVPAAYLTIPRQGVSATGNTLNGYFGGGNVPGFPATVWVTSMDRISYSTDTRTQIPSATFNPVRSSAAATSGRSDGLFGQTVQSVETQNTGYFVGGAIPGVSSTVDKVSYAVDTTAAVPGAFLSAGRSGLAATGNQTSGYFGGGAVPGLSSTVEKIDYSLDTDSLIPGASLSSARSSLSATDGNATTGYFSGGIITGPAVVSTTDKLTYATETTAVAAPASLGSARSNLAATGNSTTGYFSGGATPALVSTTDKLVYSTDTRTTVPAAFLISPRGNLAAAGNSSFGYFGGGIITGPALVSTVDKLAYSNDTVATVPGAALSSTRSNLAASANPTSGYFGGGTVPTLVSTMDKITFATDTRQIIPAAVLSSARSELSSTGARSYGLPTNIPVIV